MPRHTPNPIDTSHVDLPKELTKLTEKLADSPHDQWALQLLSADGWNHGKKRDDEA